MCSPLQSRLLPSPFIYYILLFSSISSFSQSKNSSIFFFFFSTCNIQNYFNLKNFSPDPPLCSIPLCSNTLQKGLSTHCLQSLSLYSFINRFQLGVCATTTQKLLLSPSSYTYTAKYCGQSSVPVVLMSEWYLIVDYSFLFDSFFFPLALQ